MRINPFYDTWLFFIGQHGDQLKLGISGYLLTGLFWALLIAGIVIVATNWRADPTQRTVTHAWTAVARMMIGAMWFQGSLWKLPFPESDGFLGWTSSIAENAAFGWHRAFAAEVMVPYLPLFQAVAFLAEMAFAISLMLGFAVRLFSLLAIVFVAQLWLGLYRLGIEWPWIFWFMTFTFSWFILHRAGRSLGLDAILLRQDLVPARWAALYGRAA